MRHLPGLLLDRRSAHRPARHREQPERETEPRWGQAQLRDLRRQPTAVPAIGATRPTRRTATGPRRRTTVATGLPRRVPPHL